MPTLIKLMFSIPILLALDGVAFAEQDISKLIEKAAEQGYVWVIVGLKLPGPGFKPEGTFDDQEAIRRQRETIVATREELLKTLSDCDVEVYATWPSLPAVALKVGSCALRRLADSPLVTAIQEDSPDESHKKGTSSEEVETLGVQDKTFE